MDERPATWKALHHLIRLLALGGAVAAAVPTAALARADAARDLCYRLYSVCERKRLATESLAYNGLVQSWPEISRLARRTSGKRAGMLAGDAGGAS